MTDETVKVSNLIKILIADQEIYLTSEQAKSLRDQLIAEFPIALPPLGPSPSPFGVPNSFPSQPQVWYRWTTTSQSTDQANLENWQLHADASGSSDGKPS
jgi:hypothetical protein